MLDIDFIRHNGQKIADAAASKGVKDVDIDSILELDDKRRKLVTEIQEINRKRNTLTKEEGLKIGKQLKKQLQDLKDKLSTVEKKYQEALYNIPNPPADDVKVGRDESDNEVIRTVGEQTKLDFKPRNHLELGEMLDVIDVKRAARIAGSRFGYLKNQAVQLEFALVQLALKALIAEGFTPIIPPVLIREEITGALGYWQAGGQGDYYRVPEPDEKDDLYLVGTSEQSVVPMHKDEVLEGNELPKRYVAFSSCFRREAGSYGKDVHGIFRVHQFDKVEMVSFTAPERGDSEHEYFLSLEEKFFQMLKIPYQVVKMCTGDLGFPAARKYDIEAWIPSQGKYREVTSTSTTTDFQARRLNTKYRDGQVTDFVHILNGTAFAIGRTIIAILENYQNQDGTVTVPRVLRSLVGFDKIEAKHA